MVSSQRINKVTCLRFNFADARGPVLFLLLCLLRRLAHALLSSSPARAEQPAPRLLICRTVETAEPRADLNATKFDRNRAHRPTASGLPEGRPDDHRPNGRAPANI